MFKKISNKFVSSKNLLFIKIGMLIMLLAVVIGVSYSAFQYSKEGKINKISTGTVTMKFTESDNTINLGNAVPITDEEGKNLTEEFFDFTVSTSVSGGFKVAYEVVAEKDNSSNLEDEFVKLYLERSTDGVNYEEVMSPTVYTPIGEKSVLGAPIGSMVMDTGVVTGNEIYYYRVRMWVNSTYERQNESRDFGVKINVYGTTELEEAEQERMVCSFGDYKDLQVSKETTIDLTCTNKLAAIDKKELTVEQFSSSDNGVGIIKNVSSPIRVANGYKYQLTLEGKSTGSFDLVLPKGVITDANGNENDELVKKIDVKGITYLVKYKRGSNVTAVDKSEESCTTDGSNLSCNIVLPSITVADDYEVDGWYNNTNEKVGNANETYVVTKNEELTAKAIIMYQEATIGECNDLVYDGNKQTLVSGGQGVTYQGNEQINAGSYTVTAKANDRYQFSDGSKEKSLTCRIKPKEVTVVWQEANFVYNGENQSPNAEVLSGIESETINLARTTNKNAGVHTSVASIVSVDGGQGLASNYELLGNTKEYVIEKATPKLTLSKTSGIVDVGGSATFTVAADQDGDFKNESSKVSVATVSPTSYTGVVANTSKTVTVTGVASGTSKITVTFTPTDTINYNTVSGTYTATSYNLATVGDCNDLTYNGGEQTLLSNGNGVSYNNNKRVDAGSQIVVVNANSGYRFSDGTTSKTVSCNIAKKKVAVTWEDKSTFIYNGEDQAPSVSASSGIASEELVLSRTGGVNVGSYTSTARIEAVTGGQSNSDNYTLTNNTKVFTIIKRDPVVSLRSNGEDVSSGSVIAGQTISFEEMADVAGSFSNVSDTTEVAVVSPAGYSNVVENSINLVTVTGVSNGTSIITVTFTPTNSNYNSVVKTYTVTGYKQASMGKCNTLTYNGSAQTLVSGGVGVGYVNNSKIDANTKYTVTANVNNGYKFSDGSTSKSIDCSIAKKSVVVSWGSTVEFVYDGNSQAPTATVISGVAGETIILSRTMGINVGSYTSTASILRVDGGQANKDNYDLTGTTKDFTITKATPTLTLNPTSGTVNAGKIVTFDERASVAGSFKNESNNTSVATVSPSSYTGVAANTNKTVTVTGVANGSSTITVTFTPTNTNYKEVTATYTASSYNVASTGSCTNVVYNGSAQSLVSGGTGVSYSNNSRTDAGSQTVTITANSGYRFDDGSTTKTMSCGISQKTITVSWQDKDTFTYNGSAQAPTVSTPIGGVTGETVYLKRTTGTNVGSYTSTASIDSVSGGRAKADNYRLTNTTKGFAIGKATPTVTISPTSGSVNALKSVTFDETASVAGNFTNTSGTTSVATVSPSSYTGVAANTTKTVTVTGVAAGESTITIKFTPSDSNNYNIVNKTYKVTGYNEAVIPTAANYCQSGLIYNGSAQTITKAAGTGYTFSGNSQTTAGSHTVTATLASGYRWSDNTTGTKTFSCSIGRSTPVITLSPTSGTVVAGKTMTFTEKASVAGKFTNTSGTPSVATVSPTSNSTAVSANTNQTVTVTGVASGSSTITVSFTPTDTTNYSSATKTYTTTITGAATIPDNRLCVARTYTGSAQQITSVTSGTGYTLSGYSQTNAGTYTITATLSSGYRWSDNTTGTKTFTCGIEQATPTITLSPTKGSSLLVGESKNFTERANTSGKFTNSSSSTSVATVYPTTTSKSVPENSDQTVTISGVSGGTTRIGVLFVPDDTTNYKSVTIDTAYNVTVDVTKPVWTVYSVTTESGNSSVTPMERVTIKLNGTDSNGVTSSLTASKIKVAVGGVVVTPDTKTLSAATSITNGKQYSLTIAGFSRTGSLSLIIDGGTLTDGAGNTNIQTSLTTSKSVRNYNATEVTYSGTNSGSSCTTVQCALDELSGMLGEKPKVDAKVTIVSIPSLSRSMQYGTLTVKANVPGTFRISSGDDNIFRVISGELGHADANVAYNANLYASTAGTASLSINFVPDDTSIDSVYEMISITVGTY